MRRWIGLVALVLAASTSVFAQDAASNAQQTGSISGKITIDGKPAANVYVRLPKGEFDPTQAKPLSTLTDQEGKYEFVDVPPGRYLVSPHAPGYVGPSIGFGIGGVNVSVGSGEVVTKVDIALERGAVITGRVTDADGRPIIKLPVYVMTTSDTGDPTPIQIPNSQFMMTDDRGIYRIYGVPAGKYVLGIGKLSGTTAFVFPSESSRLYPLTFAPGTTRMGDARSVEVAAGSVASGIDISVGRKSNTFTVSGRLVFGDENTVVAPGYYVIWGALQEGQRRVLPGGTPVQVDSRGVFRIENLAPGTYGAYTFSQPGSTGSNGAYSDIVNFTVSDSDLEDLVIRMLPGATITGQLVMENVSDEKLLQKLSKFRIAVLVQSEEGGDSNQIPAFADTSSDGAFQISGVKPGVARLFIYDLSGKQTFSIVRVEHNGAIAENQFPVAAGDTVSDLRVIIAQGEGSIRGQVVFADGKRPTGYQIVALAERAGAGTVNQPGIVDERGNFLLENLLPGQYTVKVRFYSLKDFKLLGIKSDAGQTVTISSGPTPLKIDIAFDEADLVEVQP